MRHRIIKLTKIKTEKIKSNKRNATNKIQGNPHSLSADSSSETAGQKGVPGYI